MIYKASLIFKLWYVLAESNTLKNIPHHKYPYTNSNSHKNSHIFKHLKSSSSCRDACREGCFKVLDSASTYHNLKIKEALHITWERPKALSTLHKLT